MGMRSLVLQSQSYGDDGVLKSMFISSFQPKSYRERVTTGPENVDEDALPKRKSLWGPQEDHLPCCVVWWLVLPRKL